MVSWNVPTDRLYHQGHTWLRLEQDNATIGLTDFAQDMLGPIKAIELPVEGTPVTAWGDCASLLTAYLGLYDLPAPLTGEVLALNPEALSQPHLVNHDPYGRGWLLQIRMTNPDEQRDLLDAGAYADLLKVPTLAEFPRSLTELFRSSPDGMIAIDQNRTILAMNPAAERLTGWSAGEVATGMFCNQIFGCHDEHGRPLHRNTCPGIDALTHLAEVVDAHYRIYTKDGRSIPVSARYRPVVPPPGKAPCAIITMRPEPSQ